MASTGLIGARLRRREDPDLVRGRGRYAADVLPEAAVLAVVRSPYPHARILAVDLEPVRRLTGVLAVWDAASMPVAELLLPDPVVSGINHRPRPVLAEDRARYQGEPVAAVVAETAAQAADAAEALAVGYEPLSPAPELAGVVELGYGDGDAMDAAAVRISRRFRLARVTAAAIEPRAAAAELAGEGLVLYSSTQWTFGVRDAVARSLSMPQENVVVVAEDVGGAFGGKGFPYPEEVLVAAAARALGRPVRWVGTRSEETAASAQAHGMEFEIELGADSQAGLVAARARFRHDLGAYSAAAFAQAENLVGHMLSIYRLPALQATVELWYSHRAPSRFIRGGARPLGNFAIERMLDFLADELGLDRLELRLRNTLRDDELPDGSTFAGIVRDGAGYSQMLTDAARAAGEAAGPFEGVGVAGGIESSGIGRPQAARAALAADGGATVLIGSTPQGQGHRTAFAQVAAERLGWPVERLEVHAGDSRLLGGSAQTAASRSAIEMGNSVAAAAGALRRRLLKLAAEALEADPADLEIGPTGAAVRGVPGRLRPWQELLPEDGLAVEESFAPPRPRSWGPNCHAARVDVDPETGEVRLIAHAVCHDAGRAINPALVEGQVQGGLAHGLGYALLEELAYDGEDNLRGTTFLDYAIPGPPELPVTPALVHFDTPTSQNPEGFRGVGEAGTIPAPAAIASAIEAALRRSGVRVELTELPITPERLRAAIERPATSQRGV